MKILARDGLILAQPLVCQFTVGNQDARRSGGAARITAHMTERKPTGDEEQRFSERPNPFLKRLRVRAGEYQREAIVVRGTTGEPIAGLWTVWRITPNQSLPFFRQAIVLNGEVVGCCCPGTFDRRTGVEVERAECLDNFRRRQPFLLAMFKIPVVPEIAEFDGFVTADDVGVTRDFPNDLICHRKSRLTAISSPTRSGIAPCLRQKSPSEFRWGFVFQPASAASNFVLKLQQRHYSE